MGDPAPPSDVDEFIEQQLKSRDKRIDNTLEPLRRRERLLLVRARQTDSFIPTGKNHLLEALISEYFRIRISAGINRLRLHGAEAGIGILTDGAEIVFPAIDLGTPRPKNLSEAAVAGDTTAYTPTAFRTSARWERSHDLSRYRVIASFHFHPDSLAFSQTDIEGYDEATYGTEGRPFRYRPDHSFGVLIPVWQPLPLDEQTEGLPLMGQLVPLSALKLLMISGPPTDTLYQAYNFDRLSLDRQIELLRGSGLKVSVVDLPAKGEEGDSVDLTPLRDILTPTE